VREQAAVFVLDGRNLILDGVDLVVNVPQLPQSQSSLFQCRGGNLTLRRCTITIWNPRRKPFALVRTVASPQPSRVRLEETMVRGPAFSALDLTGGSADIVLNRSMVVSGGTPLIRSSTSDPGGERTIHLVRTLLCSRGALLDVNAGGTPGRTSPLFVRTLGSTFAQLAGQGTTSLIVSALDVGRPEELVSWAGERNVFAGWHDWFSFNNGRAVKVTDLSSARTIWPELDPRNREEPSRWRVDLDLDRVTPADLLPLASESGGTLSRVAAPSPFLLEKTVEAFGRSVIPRLAARTPGPATPKFDPMPRAAIPPNPPPAGAKPGATVPVPAERELAFDLSANPWHGDLGLFLRDQLRKEDRRLRVLVAGSGAYFSTPIRLPEGLSLELEPDPARPHDASPITWSAIRESSGEALIDVRGGDLVLTNVRLTRDGSAGLKHLIRVDAGHLVLNRCSLIAPGVVEQGGGDLISFRATSTEPRQQAQGQGQGQGPFQPPVDRPVCQIRDTLLLTGGDALRADVARGLVALSNCALAVGKSAFDLRPTKVARSRFDAGLWLDHCTVAAEGSFVNLGPWPGTAPGPDRPWLVSTKDSAFLASYDRSGASTESVLLRVEDDSLDRGALFWQAYNDSFEVTHFTARAGLPLASPLRPDVHRQWIKLWGEPHMHYVTGPIWPRGSVVSTPSVKFYARLQSGKVVPADLELDRNYHPGRPRLSVGADLSRLQINLRKHDRR
jgi:serine/threonine-protein kinase